MSQVITAEVECKPRSQAAERRARGEQRRARRQPSGRRRKSKRAKAKARALLRTVRRVYLYAGPELGTLRISKAETLMLIDKLGSRLVATKTGSCGWFEIPPF
jgi:hypothetical protein